MGEEAGKRKVFKQWRKVVIAAENKKPASQNFVNKKTKKRRLKYVIVIDLHSLTGS